jgi:hypothetical protein
MLTCVRLPLAVLALVLLAGTGRGQSTVTLRASGTGADRDAAVKQALADAVLQALATMLDADTLSKQKAMVEARVLPKSATLVKSHEVTKEEKAAAGKVSVQVKAVVDKTALAARLEEVGIAGKGSAKAQPKADAHLGAKVVEFCKAKVGQTVGDGECGTLAQEALAYAGAAGVAVGKDNPGPGDYVWGELVFVLEVRDGKRVREPKDGTAKPGDIVQYRDAMLPSTFKGRGALFLTPHHTAIVAEVKRNGDLVVFEQNVGGTREVVKSTQTIGGLRQGWLRVYRPVPK